MGCIAPGVSTAARVRFPRTAGMIVTASESRLNAVLGGRRGEERAVQCGCVKGSGSSNGRESLKLESA